MRISDWSSDVCSSGLARKKLRASEDPKGERPSGLSFETLAREWHNLQKPRWAERHAKKVLQSLENEVFPLIGSKSVDAIDAPTILDVVRRMEKRGALEGGARVDRKSTRLTSSH